MKLMTHVREHVDHRETEWEGVDWIHLA